jgi:hypothetical protein
MLFRFNDTWPGNYREPSVTERGCANLEGFFRSSHPTAKWT